MQHTHQGRLTAFLTDVDKTPAPQPADVAHEPARAILWPHIASVTILATTIAGIAGYLIGASTREPETITIPASAACIEGMTAADRALIASDRASEHTNDVLARMGETYTAILTGSDLDIDQARANLTAARMLYTQDLSRARDAEIEYGAASVLCPPQW
jgi:hypothetical protein